MDYAVCPVCLNRLEVRAEKITGDEVAEGELVCTECGRHYLVYDGIPILTPPGTRPYDWLSDELGSAIGRFGPKEALRKIVDGEIGPKRLAPNEPILSPEELKVGEYMASEKFLQDRWGSIAAAREHFRGEHHRNQKLLDMMASMGRFSKAHMILDIGTGLGYMLQFLAECFSHAQIFSVDIAYINTKAVRRRFRIFGINHDVHLITADALQPPFPNDQFDAVESFAGSGSIVGFCGVIGQAYRMLKNGGWFVADLPGLERADRDNRALIEAVGREFIQSWLDRARTKLGIMPTSEKIVETMEEHGFHDISSVTVDSSHVISGRK